MFHLGPSTVLQLNNPGSIDGVALDDTITQTFDNEGLHTVLTYDYSGLSLQVGTNMPLSGTLKAVFLVQSGTTAGQS